MPIDKSQSDLYPRAPVHTHATPLYLELPLPPSANNMFVNGKRGGRYPSATYAKWKRDAGFLARSQSKGRIEGPFAVQINAVRPDKRRRDIDNLIKPSVDLLVSCGFVTDDSEMQTVQASWVEKGPPLWVAIRPCTRWGEPRWVSKLTRS